MIIANVKLAALTPALAGQSMVTLVQLILL